LVTELPVGQQGCGRGVVQREQPVAAQFGVAHQQHPTAGVEVLIIKRDYLATTHAGDRHQADQCLDGRPAQRRFQPVGLGEQCGDVGGRIQVGHHAARPAGKQAGRGHLSGRVEGAQVGGEATHRLHPEPQPASAGAGRQANPGQRVGHRDRARATLFQVGDELLEQSGLALELEPQTAPQIQVAS
jgi:hypothetical protein